MWSWHLAQPTVRPMNAVETVSTAAIANSPRSLPSRMTAPAGEEAEGEQVVGPRLHAVRGRRSAAIVVRSAVR